MKRLMLMMICTAMLAGCVNSNVGGNLDRMNPTYVKQHVIVGKTTKEEVRRLFGNPSPKWSNIDSTGEEDWAYELDGGTNMLNAAGSILPVPGLSTAAGLAEASQTGKRSGLLQISFDKRGIVRRWMM